MGKVTVVKNSAGSKAKAGSTFCHICSYSGERRVSEIREASRTVRSFENLLQYPALGLKSSIAL